ncbi:flippase [Thermodesulfovibrio sp. Kuro-1]|uniref:flippase n=1 Tax=Thermodesulfovibrio sp. Kuro-1 TaxID=2580394 RepID=UPI0011427F8E|nr:flippase [Thermodesulfovibrio sp. Kuro-1]
MNLISSKTLQLKSKIYSLLTHTGFRKYFANTSWLMAEKVFRTGVTLFVGVWVARYLGPEQFGLLSYAQSFVALFTAFATLGLDGIVVRELVKDESRREELLGTAFWLKVIGSVAVLLILAVAVNFTSNDKYTNMLVFIIASATIFQSFNVIDMYFQAKVLGKYIAFANSLALFLGSSVKVALILNHAPLEAFALAVVFDGFILAIGYVYFYGLSLRAKRSNLHSDIQNAKFSIIPLKFKRQTAVSLLKDSWPLILSGIVIMIYMRIDQVMIKEMLGAEAVGQYAAAVRISEAVFFLFPVMINSMAPAFYNSLKIDNKTISEKRIKIFYSTIFYLCLIWSIFIFIISDKLILLLYGHKFSESISIFKVHVFSNILAFIGGVTNLWYLANGYSNLTFYRTLQGAILNIILNCILINKLGTIGAAIATVLSYFHVAVITMFLSKKTRKNGNLFILSLIYPFKVITFKES